MARRPRKVNTRLLLAMEKQCLELFTQMLERHKKERAYWEGVIAENAEDLRMLREEFKRMTEKAPTSEPLTSPPPEPTVPPTKQEDPQ